MGKLSGVVIHEGLVVVDLNGFDTPPETCIDEATGAEFDAIPDGIIDPPGSANWLCEQYGMGGEEGDGPGILHTDYDSSSNEPWRFSVLVDADESEDLQDFARKAGYEVISAVPVAEPMVYGRGRGRGAVRSVRRPGVGLCRTFRSAGFRQIRGGAAQVHQSRDRPPGV